MSVMAYDPVRLVRSDLLIAMIVGVVAAALSFYLSAQLDPAAYGSSGFNVWFQADPPRVIRAMVDGASRYHYRTSVHPLFSLLTTPAMRGLVALGVAPITAGKILVAICGFLAAGSLLLALRGLGLPTGVTLAWVAVFLASATYLHWFCMIETYAFGGATICFMLLVLTCVRAARGWAWGIASAATLSVTVTNWMLGVAATFFRLGLRRAIYITVAAGLAVVCLSIVQRALYPEARYFFFPSAVLNEHQYSQVHRTTGLSGWMPLANLRSMLLTSAVAPTPEVVPGDQAGGHDDELIVSNQHSPFAYGPAGWLACAAWAVMIALGVVGGWSNPGLRPVFLAVAVYLAGQLVLNLVYGPITFLYATNFFPALVVLGGFGWFSRFRAISVGAAAVFVVFAAISNFARFEEAAGLANTVFRADHGHGAAGGDVTERSPAPP